MTDRLHGHLPFRLLEEFLPLILERGLAPEVALQGPDLDRTGSESAFERLGRELDDAGLPVTVHGPFLDLNPGATEPLVAAATARRYRQALEAAALLGADLVVFHPGYEHWRYNGRIDTWLEASLDFWPPLLERAARLGLMLALENVYDTGPEPLLRLLGALDHPAAGHCFDVGHWNLFCHTPLAEWIHLFGPRLVHLHLHDNHGDADSHLPVGEGEIDFRGLFLELHRRKLHPSMTLEAHSREDLLRSLSRLPAFL